MPERFLPLTRCSSAPGRKMKTAARPGNPPARREILFAGSRVIKAFNEISCAGHAGFGRIGRNPLCILPAALVPSPFCAGSISEGNGKEKSAPLPLEPVPQKHDRGENNPNERPVPDHDCDSTCGTATAEPTQTAEATADATGEPAETAEPTADATGEPRAAATAEATDDADASDDANDDRGGQSGRSGDDDDAGDDHGGSSGHDGGGDDGGSGSDDAPGDDHGGSSGHDGGGDDD